MTDDPPERRAAAAPAADGHLYVRIARVLRERIETGAYPVGSQLPTEADLGSEFATSRNTVREALRRLVEHGLIRRRQGAGSLVMPPARPARYSLSFGTLEDLFANSRDTHFVVNAITDTTLSPDIADRIGAVPGRDWLLATGVRWTEPGGTPIAFIESYIPAEFRRVTEGFWTLQTPFYAALEAASGRTITEVVQEVRSVEMPRHVSAAFGLEGGLSLQLMRRYLTAEGTLIASFNWHRGDQFTYHMRIALQANAPSG